MKSELKNLFNAKEKSNKKIKIDAKRKKTKDQQGFPKGDQPSSKLIILSLDSIGSQDAMKLQDSPGFQTMLTLGSGSFHVKSIYPSLTYPAHASLVTGKVPRNHGIINNTKLEPGVEQPAWYWYAKDISGETLWDIAKSQKKTVASLLWPITGGAKIKWNLPEIFPVRSYQSQISQVLAAGSPSYVLELNQHFKHLRNGIKQPQLDDFTHASALYTYEKYQPDVTLVHYVAFDALRHEFGLDSKEGQKALTSYGQRVTDWVSLLKKRGELENTTLVVLGDHSHKSVNRVIKPNVLLRKLKLFSVIREEVMDWQAIFKSCDGSGYLYLRKDNDNIKRILEDNFTVLANTPGSGIKRLLTQEEATLRGADPRCSFMMEAEEGCYFDDSIHGDFDAPVEESMHSYRSCHGFDPTIADYDTIFLAMGPLLKKGVNLKEMNLVDIAPTLAKVMGSSLWGVDGRIRYELLDL